VLGHVRSEAAVELIGSSSGGADEAVSSYLRDSACPGNDRALHDDEYTLRSFFEIPANPLL